MNRLLFIISFVIFLLVSCTTSHNTLNEDDIPWKPPTTPATPVSEKPKILWIDASANFKYFANSKESIVIYLEKAKSAGFTDVIVDVRPTCGDVLFKSNIVAEVKKLGDIERTATWDYLAVFIEEAHKQNLKIHANLNTMVGGNMRDGGVVYRDAAKAAWLTQMYYPTGIISIKEDNKSHAKFFNPINPEVQSYMLSIFTELAQNYLSLDGIILDRARFNSMESDFSELSKKEFEKYAGQTLSNFPTDIFTWNGDKVVPGKQYNKWLEFRAKTIYDFFEKARNSIKSVNKNIKFGTYTGSWYSTYYNEGVNWASKKYDPSKYYNWATPEYKNFGYATLLDIYMTGAYGKTLFGTTSEWTVEGAILNAKKVTRGDVPVCGSLYGLNFENKPQDAEEATYICLTKGDGLMFFDMIYLIMYDQWDAVKKGIDRALATDKNKNK